jgi:hypothetical protein
LCHQLCWNFPHSLIFRQNLPHSLSV